MKDIDAVLTEWHVLDPKVFGIVTCRLNRFGSNIYTSARKTKIRGAALPLAYSIGLCVMTKAKS